MVNKLFTYLLDVLEVTASADQALPTQVASSSLCSVLGPSSCRQDRWLSDPSLGHLSSASWLPQLSQLATGFHPQKFSFPVTLRAYGLVDLPVYSSVFGTSLITARGGKFLRSSPSSFLYPHVSCTGH